jgi:site-specific DNA recombinase
MNKPKNRSQVTSVPSLRCAIYTRKSTEDGLEQEFNSLDAQRESGEAYIKSQAHEGWECLPQDYDDGGFTGGNMERPALRRLIADIEAGQVDCVVVYKVDRLSRSLLDFSKLLEVFERHKVAFVSVTQQFNTTNSMGRLMLNVLLSFAQFEREIISERTRDKIAAARRKGKWSGGMPLLGYDVDPKGSKLVVNQSEATQVRTIFELYLEHQSMIETVKELDKRGWKNKRWVTKKGKVRGGLAFSKTSIFKLLTNVTYVGQLRYKDEVHKGEHEAIVTQDLWQGVQSQLQKNGRAGGVATRNQFGALLKGIIRCVPCDCAMIPSHSTRKGAKRYRYYVCNTAQKRGWHNCPSKSIPAPDIERFVVEKIRSVGKDACFVKEIVEKSRTQAQVQIEQFNAELNGLDRDLVKWNNEIRRLVLQSQLEDFKSPAVDRLAELQDRLGHGQRRATELREQTMIMQQRLIEESDVTAAMDAFDPVWDSMTLREQIRIVHLLVEKVDYDGTNGKVSITFHQNGIKKLAQEICPETAA